MPLTCPATGLLAHLGQTHLASLPPTHPPFTSHSPTSPACPHPCSCTRCATARPKPAARPTSNRLGPPSLRPSHPCQGLARPPPLAQAVEPRPSDRPVPACVSARFRRGSSPAFARLSRAPPLRRQGLEAFGRRVSKQGSLVREPAARSVTYP